jgi:hypothetical protein
MSMTMDQATYGKVQLASVAIPTGETNAKNSSANGLEKRLSFRLH